MPVEKPRNKIFPLFSESARAQGTQFESNSGSFSFDGIQFYPIFPQRPYATDLHVDNCRSSYM